jgi:tetratricopeptide (TPR) repeat protein
VCLCRREQYHPDKNRGREKAAADVFQAVNAAYHFLTTNNFDYKRWKQSFTIPPMQSLEEVLVMALSGEDPYNVEQLLRKRGEYRPHRDFGVNLSIPWNAGYADDPSYEVRARAPIPRRPCRLRARAVHVHVGRVRVGRVRVGRVRVGRVRVGRVRVGRVRVQRARVERMRAERVRSSLLVVSSLRVPSQVGAGSVYTNTQTLENGADGEEKPKEIGSTAGADDDAYALALDELVSRGGDLAKLRRMAVADASGADMRNELKRLGYVKLGERTRAVSALKAAANGRVMPTEHWPKRAASADADTPSGAGSGAAPACSTLATVAGEAALLNELAVVEAPRVRELGLYQKHSEAYLARFGKQAELGANDEARPWEATALGRDVNGRYVGGTWEEGTTAPEYVRAKTYTSITETHERAAEFAEMANDQALEGYRAKNYLLCYDAASEAIRLNPNKVAYYGNRAAAALKLRGQSHLRQAVDDCKIACALEPTYVKGYTRSAEAHFAMGEPHTVSIAIEMYQTALRYDPNNKSIMHALERVRTIYSADYE